MGRIKSPGGKKMKSRLGKNFKCLGAWNRIELSLEEEYELQQELRTSNIGIMKECLHDAKELLGDNGQSLETRLILASALFNKRAQQSYSIYQTYLDNVVQEMKRKEEQVRRQGA
jgi:hypothetical protein